MLPYSTHVEKWVAELVDEEADEDSESRSESPLKDAQEMKQQGDFFDHYARLEGRYDLIDEAPSSMRLPSMTVVEHPDAGDDDYYSDYSSNADDNNDADDDEEEADDECVSESLSSSGGRRRKRKTGRDQSIREKYSQSPKRVVSFETDASSAKKGTRVKVGGSGTSHLAALSRMQPANSPPQEMVTLRDAGDYQEDDDSVSVTRSDDAFAVDRSAHMVPPLRDGRRECEEMEVASNSSDMDISTRLERMIARGEDISKVELPSVEVGASLLSQAKGCEPLAMQSLAGQHSDDDADTGCLAGLFSKSKSKRSRGKAAAGRKAKGFGASKKQRLLAVELDLVGAAVDNAGMLLSSDEELAEEASAEDLRYRVLESESGGPLLSVSEEVRRAGVGGMQALAGGCETSPPMRRFRNAEGKLVVSTGDLINEIGFGKFHYQLIGLCGLGYVADSLWGEAITLVIAPVQNEWHIDTRLIGYFPAMLFAGMCVGGLFWGRVSDVIGRRKPFSLTLAISGLSGVLLAFAPSYGWALLLLTLLGFGLGGAVPVDGAILAEFLPVSHRGSLLVSLSVFWSLGEFLSCLLAVSLVPQNSCEEAQGCDSAQNVGWRYLVLACAAVNCSMLLFRLGVNESPNFLICQGEGGRARALDVLRRMAEINGCGHKVRDDMVLATATANDVSAKQKRWLEIVYELFDDTPRRRLRVATPLIWALWFCSSFGLTMFGVFLPKFLDRKQIRLSSIYGDALLFAACALPGPWIGSMMVESQRFGRRYTMALAALAIAVLMIVFVFSYDESAVVILAGTIGLFSQIFYAALMCYTPEAYPTDIRTTASGLASGVRHLANILGPIVGANTFGDSALCIAAAALFFAAVAAFSLPFDTRKRSLVSTVRLSV